MLSLREIFQRPPRDPAGPSGGTHYAFKPSLAGGARQFDLTEQGLAWRSGGRSGVWPLDEIAAVRLSFRPTSMQPRRFRADIAHASGDNVTLYSATWQTAALMTPQDGGYRAFIVELHKRLATMGSKAAFTAGIGRTPYLAGLIAMALVGLGIAALLLRALWIGEFTAALFLGGFAALFVWQIGGFMKRNRPRSYTPDALPADVLP